MFVEQPLALPGSANYSTFRLAGEHVEISNWTLAREDFAENIIKSNVPVFQKQLGVGNRNEKVITKADMEFVTDAWTLSV